MQVQQLVIELDGIRWKHKARQRRIDIQAGPSDFIASQRGTFTPSKHLLHTLEIGFARALS